MWTEIERPQFSSFTNWRNTAKVKVLVLTWRQSCLRATLAVLLLTYSVLVCVCVRCSNSPLSLEQMPVTDVIQLAAVIVNNTMNGELTNLLRPSIRTSQLIRKTIKWQH